MCLPHLTPCQFSSCRAAQHTDQQLMMLMMLDRDVRLQQSQPGLIMLLSLHLLISDKTQDTRDFQLSFFLILFVIWLQGEGGGGIRCQVWLKRKPVASIGCDNSTEVFCRNWKQCSCEVQPYLNILYISEGGASRQFSLYADYASYVGPPKHQGTPCFQRYFHLSFVLEFGQRLWKHE